MPRGGYLSVHAFATAAHGLVDLFLGVAAGEVLALVVGLLALGETEFDLGVPIVEIDLERDEGDAVVAELAHHLGDLLAVQEEFADAAWLVVGPGALRVLGDVHPVQEDLTVVLVAEGVDERRAAG